MCYVLAEGMIMAYFRSRVVPLANAAPTVKFCDSKLFK